MYLSMTFLVLLVTVTVAFGASDRSTPYGDYSQRSSAYGTCKENLPPQDAERALRGYFGSKGLKATNLRHKERFIEAEIYRNNRMVDKVLFDRKTGRIRSTY